MSTDRGALRSLIGGRWAISWQGYLLAWPWAVLFTFSSTPSLWVSDSAGEGLVRGFTTGTLTYVPVGIVLYLASVTVLRKRCDTPVSIAMVALVGGVAWTARSITMLGYLNLQGLTSDVSPAARLIAGFLQGAIAIVLTAWLFATVSQFYARRRQLLSELVHEELAANHISDDIEKMRESVLAIVQQTIDTSVRTLDEQLDQDSVSVHEIDALATVSQDMSRNLARTLWKSETRAAHESLVTVLRSAVMHRPFAYWGLLPGPLFGLFVLSVYWPVSGTVIALVTVTVFSFVIAAVANTLTPRVNASRGMGIYIASIALLASSALVMQMTMNFLNLTTPSGDVLLWVVAMNFGVFFPLIGIGAHVGTAQHEVLSQLRRSINNAEIRREALFHEETRLRRNLAYALHGGLQADLTASAMRAQHAIDEGDVLTARESLTQARNHIRRVIQPPEHSTNSLQKSIDAVTDTWDGIVDITTRVCVSQEPGAHCVTMLQDVILEGIGNAVRHGGAKAIDIEIDDDEGDVRVTVTDNGHGNSPTTTGLGTSMLNELAPCAWSLTPATTGGSILTVKLRNSN